MKTNKELEKLEKELLKAQKKLSNESYVAKAPKDVVAKEKKKVANLEDTKSKLAASISKLEKL